MKLWSETTFYNIVNLWGEIVACDEKTKSTTAMDEARILILTEEAELIEENVVLRKGEERFTKRVEGSWNGENI